jgi:hypothetical protein
MRQLDFDTARFISEQSKNTSSGLILSHAGKPKGRNMNVVVASLIKYFFTFTFAKLVVKTFD